MNTRQMKSSRCLHPICSVLAASGKTITEGEALRLKGVGRKTLRELIREGFITGRSEEDQLRREEEWEQAKRRREKAWSLAAFTRMKARRAKVKNMIVDTEARLRELRGELERLNKALLNSHAIYEQTPME